MITATATAVFQSDLQTVWETVTALETCVWRSDISRIQVLDGKRFTEYTKGGYPTQFTITVSQPPTRWECDMENGNLKGRFVVALTREGDKTRLLLTEEIHVKKALMKPFARAFLRNRQALYLADLQKALG